MTTLNDKFRSDAEVAEIKKHHSPPIHHREYLSIQEISWLRSLQESLPKVQMTDMYRNSFRSEDNGLIFQEVAAWARERFYPVLGDFQVSTAFFYESPTPVSATDSTIHTDVWDDSSIVDKTILIPLSIEPTLDTYTMVFDQHYYHYGAAYAGKVGNKQVFGHTVIKPDNYRLIEGFVPEQDFSTEIYFNHLTHKPYSNFYGLTVADFFKWRIRGAIIFDRTQLHCSDHYFSVNTRKWFAIWTNRGRYES